MALGLSREAKVGIFTVLGIMVFLISIILLGGDKLAFRSTYPLRVMLPDVQGLARGSVVTLDGVPIGNIRTLTFVDGSKSINVLLDIDTEFRNRMTEGSRASVKTQGALGDKYIFVEAGPLNGKPLTDNTVLESSNEGDFLDILTKKGAEIGQVLEVVKDARELLHQLTDNHRTANLMEGLNSDTASIRELAAEAKRPIAHLDSILTKIDRGDGTLGALINDPTLHTKLTQLFGGSPRNKFLTPMIRESIKESEQK